MGKEASTSKKKGKGQADRLSLQHLKGGGVLGIFGDEAILELAPASNTGFFAGSNPVVLTTSFDRQPWAASPHLTSSLS